MLREGPLFGNTPKLTLARIGGIPLRLDVTFLLVPLVLYIIFDTRYPQAAWQPAALCSLGVFFSILLHEAGHAAMAKAQQVGVAQIVVGGFYGFASLKRQTAQRKVLIRILAAGPLANLLIFLAIWGALTLAGTGLTRSSYGLAEAGWMLEVLRILAFVNLAMFVFNSLPAYPLDGGRILGRVLDRKLAPRTSLRIVSILGAAAGGAMVFVGLGINLFLAVFGVMIVMTNLRRLRAKPRARAGI